MNINTCTGNLSLSLSCGFNCLTRACPYVPFLSQVFMLDTQCSPKTPNNKEGFEHAQSCVLIIELPSDQQSNGHAQKRCTSKLGSHGWFITRLIGLHFLTRLWRCRVFSVRFRFKRASFCGLSVTVGEMCSLKSTNSLCLSFCCCVKGKLGKTVLCVFINNRLKVWQMPTRGVDSMIANVHLKWAAQCTDKYAAAD